MNDAPVIAFDPAVVKELLEINVDAGTVAFIVAVVDAPTKEKLPEYTKTPIPMLVNVKRFPATPEVIVILVFGT